jgi:hypothetical protein
MLWIISARVTIGDSTHVNVVFTAAVTSVIGQLRYVNDELQDGSRTYPVVETKFKP